MLRHLCSLGLIVLGSTAHLAMTTSPTRACSPVEGPFFSAPLPGQTVGPDATIGVAVGLGKALTWDAIKDSIRLVASDGTPVSMALQGVDAQEGIAFFIGTPSAPLAPDDYTLDASGGMTDENAELHTFTVASAGSSAPMAAPEVHWSRVRFAGVGSPLPATCDNGSGQERHTLELNYPDAQAALGIWYSLSFAMDDGSTLVRHAVPSQVYDSPTAHTTVWTPANTSCVTVTPFAADAQPGPATVVCLPQSCSVHPAGTYGESTATQVDCASGVAIADAPGECPDGDCPNDDEGCTVSSPASPLPLGLAVLLVGLWALRRRR